MAGKAGHRGFGHVRKLPSGRWQASYIGPDLRRHTAPTTFVVLSGNRPHEVRSRAAAEVWLNNEDRLIQLGTWTSPKSRAAAEVAAAESIALTLSVYAKSWMQTSQVKPKTLSDYQGFLDRVILPGLGDVEVRKITPLVVRNWHSDLPGRTLTQNARAYSLLKTILATAVDDEILPSNPCRVRGAGTAPRTSKTQVVTREQVELLAAHLPERFALMPLFGFWIGAMRFGEVTEIRRSDIDLDNGVVDIARAVVWVGGEAIVGSPKSYAGRRTVSIPSWMIEPVAQHLRRMPMTGRTGLLFPSVSDPGRHLQSGTFRRPWMAARESIGRPDLRFHDLRHSGSTWMMQHGWNVADLKLWMGHGAGAVTQSYLHSDIARLSALIEAAG